MSDWDSEDFQNKWDNENQPTGDGLGSWDDDEEEQTENTQDTSAGQTNSAPKPKSKAMTMKKLAELREKEQMGVIPENDMDPYLEKKKKQELQEAADFEHSKTLFGALAVNRVEGELDKMDPKTEKEFEQYATAVATYITKYDKSYFYPALLKNILKHATVNSTSAEVGEIGKSLTVIVNEKLKAEKNAGGKKKPTKAQTTKKSLQMDSELQDYDQFNDEDFM
ncbi:hypothetical protein SAMD00019534_087060 [Acytostelium subglobosum LB1]|uniref:hypothetical protein n=1 Tax=Acytostelium subglobosum LB1 TaxID=1410327 RepID=UPI000644D89B|nr:hypothetical protein SAMD00019534_087060 [Acytostelium subglobosum LB1]GAM25531.1 hypothetical protein SAMD00019534_087060 [Acytostelium subglobosum LB1]|eukprot:XP_012751517.1 hypothetical protein SAMD00019534_087060 [Acytostelium subglobosum LB1]